MFLVWSVCLFVCLSVGLLANLWTDLDEIVWRVGHGSRTKWYNVSGDPDHALDPGVQSPKSGSSGSAEVCALWVLLVLFYLFISPSGSDKNTKHTSKKHIHVKQTKHIQAHCKTKKLRNNINTCKHTHYIYGNERWRRPHTTLACLGRDGTVLHWKLLEKNRLKIPKERSYHSSDLISSYLTSSHLGV